MKLVWIPSRWNGRKVHTCNFNAIRTEQPKRNSAMYSTMWIHGFASSANRWWFVVNQKTVSKWIIKEFYLTH